MAMQSIKDSTAEQNQMVSLAITTRANADEVSLVRLSLIRQPASALNAEEVPPQKRSLKMSGNG